MDIQPAIDLLRANFSAESPAAVEDVARACGIDLTAPFSYREVVEMARALALSPYVSSVWTSAGERRYFAAHYVPTARGDR